MHKDFAFCAPSVEFIKIWFVEKKNEKLKEKREGEKNKDCGQKQRCEKGKKKIRIWLEYGNLLKNSRKINEKKKLKCDFVYQTIRKLYKKLNQNLNVVWN